MENNTPPPCPNTVTVRRNPPRRARATPQSSNFHDITPFPSDDILSAPTPQKPSTSEIKNLKVFLRIRPAPSPNQAPRVKDKTAWPKIPSKKNTATGITTSKTKSFTTCISVNDSKSLTLSVPSSLQDSKRIKSETYGGFSHVFPSDSSQFDVYERMVKPMVDEFLNGRSGMLAALGPSGSGKTHTVFGSPRDPGMVSLAIRHIFKETEIDSKQASRSFYIAIFEIYSERGKAEKLFDLLPDGGELFMQQSSVKGLKEVLISNAEQAESLIAQAMIKRATAMTNTNSQSSRSQCIINIRAVPQKCKGVVNPKSNDAVLTIIDLAGAEREKRTGNQGTRLLESNFINNTLMVFSLCLRSLLEHQKNPKKPLQKHFQSSMLTRYLRDYLEGKKRMTLLLTAKSGEDDYLDTSYLLRQASPYMQIKYNEVEPSNMVPKKRHYQASSIIDNVKQSPSIEHLKRMKSEHTTQNDKKCVEECKSSKKDAAAARKLDASSSVSLKSECESRAGSERSHIIMRNFARVIWNVLKQYNSKLKVAEREVLSLKESLECEKEKYLALEMQFNEFRASCSCCKGVKVTNHIEDCSSVDLDYPRYLDQEEAFHAKSSFEPRIEQLEEEHLLRTICAELDSENSDREVSVLSSETGHHIALEVGAERKETFDTLSSSEPTLYQSNDEHMRGTTCKELDSEISDREVSVSSSNPGQPSDLKVDSVSNIPSETFDTLSSSEPTLYQSDDEHMHGTTTTCKELDSEISDRKVSVSSSKPGQPIDLKVDAVGKIPSETLVTKSSPEVRLYQSDDEHMHGTTCKELGSEKSEREVTVSLSKQMSPNTLEVDAETFHTDSSFEPRPYQSDDKNMLDTTCTESDSEKSVWEVAVPAAKLGHPNALEVEGVSKIPSETFPSESSSVPRSDESDEHVPGTTFTELDSEKSDRAVAVSSSKPVHHNALEVDAVSKEAFHAQSTSEPIPDLSIEEPLLCTSSTQLDHEKSDRLVSGVSASSSKPADHNALEVDSVSKIPSELSISSSLTKADNLDPSSPKDPSCTKTKDDMGVKNSCKPSRPKEPSCTKTKDDMGVKNSCKPSRPKRTLVPAKSMLSKDLSTFDLFDESDKLKGNRSTKVAANDPKRSNASVSLLHLLKGRQSNLRL